MYLPEKGQLALGDIHAREEIDRDIDGDDNIKIDQPMLMQRSAPGMERFPKKKGDRQKIEHHKSPAKQEWPFAFPVIEPEQGAIEPLTLFARL